MSCDCEIEIILRLCLYCKTFSPLHCIVKATRKKPLSRGFGSFLMEYLMKKTHRADEKRSWFFLSKKTFVLSRAYFWRVMDVALFRAPLSPVVMSFRVAAIS